MGALTMEIEKVNNSFLTEKQQKRREKEQKHDKKYKIIGNIFLGIAITAFVLFFLIKYIFVIGIVGAILLFMFIAGCAKGK